MTKADIIKHISGQIGLEKTDIKNVVETFYKVVIDSLCKKENIYLRGFGTFYLKKRKEKLARDIGRNKSVVVPECYKPKFRPVKSFVESVRNNVK
jgi:DNA-binding protein HU-beta